MKESINEMKQKKAALEDRIARLTRDVKRPLDPDFSEQALELENRDLMLQLLKVEQDNLQALNKALEAAMMEG